MENDPFVDDFPIKTSIYKGFSMAMLNNQMVREIFTYNKYTYQILPFMEDHPSMKKMGSPGKRK